MAVLQNCNLEAYYYRDLDKAEECFIFSRSGEKHLENY